MFSKASSKRFASDGPFLMTGSGSFLEGNKSGDVGEPPCKLTPMSPVIPLLIRTATVSSLTGVPSAISKEISTSFGSCLLSWIFFTMPTSTPL